MYHINVFFSLTHAPLAPADYLELSQILILEAGENEVCVNITILPDDIYELVSDVFLVCIGSDDPSVVVTIAKSLVAIIDSTSK